MGVPQIAPQFGAGRGNVIFDGLGQDEDFGLEQITGNPADRYKFRSHLRNVGLQPAFFHNGAFTRLEDAIYHHLPVFESARDYNPIRAGVDKDLTLRLGPIEPVLVRLDPLLLHPPALIPEEFENLVTFVRSGLLDSRAEPGNLCALIPVTLPSGMSPLRFEECPQRSLLSSRLAALFRLGHANAVNVALRGNAEKCVHRGVRAHEFLALVDYSRSWHSSRMSGGRNACSRQEW